MLARAVAHHTDCTFIRVSGSELVQKFIGEGKNGAGRGRPPVPAQAGAPPRAPAPRGGPRRDEHLWCGDLGVRGARAQLPAVPAGARMVRELFVMAREHAPSIIFMDEIDSIGSSRLEGGSGGDSEVQRTMLELLNQLDGFEATKNIKVRGRRAAWGRGSVLLAPRQRRGACLW